MGCPHCTMRRNDVANCFVASRGSRVVGGLTKYHAQHMVEPPEDVAPIHSVRLVRLG